ncbi:hypothetical protein LJC20_05085 [Eubacteriales bacterium OttesenSCG-928-M02]|nr:hypothetical protein [Eubacteriales bacterium OttesenSCG-928-M02]
MGNQRVSFFIGTAAYESIQQLAAKQNCTASQIVRQLLDKGLGLEAARADIDLIRSNIREELETILKPQIERMVKLEVKAGIVAAASYFLNAEVLAAFVNPAHQVELHVALEEAKKLGVGYMRAKDSRIDEVIKEGETQIKRRV